MRAACGRIVARMPLATILVPTHDHGPTLMHSLGSALSQTVDDFEIVVVGDGVPDVTRRLVAELTAQDARIRFLDCPKGENRGEHHRHTAILTALSPVVCYLADDDLWMPDHLETMLPLLEHADFATSVPLVVEPGGALDAAPVHLGATFVRERLMAGTIDVPLSCVGHTVAAYRDLPIGWAPPPPGAGSGLTMWQRFFARPATRADSSDRMTVLNFKSIDREGVEPDRRAAELGHWAGRLAERDFQLELTQAALRSALTGWHRCEGEHHSAERHALHLEAQLTGARGLRGMLRRGR